MSLSPTNSPNGTAQSLPVTLLDSQSVIFGHPAPSYDPAPRGMGDMMREFLEASSSGFINDKGGIKIPKIFVDFQNWLSTRSANTKTAYLTDVCLVLFDVVFREWDSSRALEAVAKDALCVEAVNFADTSLRQGKITRDQAQVLLGDVQQTVFARGLPSSTAPSVLRLQQTLTAGMRREIYIESSAGEDRIRMTLRPRIKKSEPLLPSMREQDRAALFWVIDRNYELLQFNKEFWGRLNEPVLLGKIIKDQKSDHSLSAATINRRIAALCKFSKFMTQLRHPTSREQLLSSRFERSDLNPPTKDIVQPRVLAVEQVTAIAQVLEDRVNCAETTQERYLAIRNRMLFYLLLDTAMRANEAAMIKISDIDLKTQQVFIHAKGGKQRWIPLEGRVVPLLQEFIPLREQFCDERNAAPELQHGALLLDRNAQRGIARHEIHRIISDLGRDAGIKENVFPHMLRGTTATELIRNGAPDQIVQNLLGHKSVVTTKDMYCRTTPEDTADLMKQFVKLRYRGAKTTKQQPLSGPLSNPTPRRPQIRPMRRDKPKS